MSDGKRATLITVGASKSGKTVNKTVRLNVNLDESNERNYPELNYKKLVIGEERKQVVHNGKTPGLDPFSDNDDDVERVARKFEQKYGGNSTYGRKGRTKHDEFADIGAGYDENDSFIDNTDGYDEMIPPECDTLYGGFYINSGSLEFKNVSQSRLDGSDNENHVQRRNKRRISSSSSDESSESSSESESQDEKEANGGIVNGAIDSHKTDHRKKKNKKIEKNKPKRLHRGDSSAATSSKQTSDDNVHADNESADSRTSQSDSLTSKPAPSSENAVTSDSSRDVPDAKVEAKIPSSISQILEELSACIARLRQTNSNYSSKELEHQSDPYVLRLERALTNCNAEARVRRVAWTKAALLMDLSRTKLFHRARALAASKVSPPHPPLPPQSTNTTTGAPTSNTISTTLTTAPAVSSQVSKRVKSEEEKTDMNIDYSALTPEEREKRICEVLQRLKALIEERKPSMMQNYKAECDRVAEENKKLKIAASACDGSRPVERRLPKRRFPWCQRTRALLFGLTRLADTDRDAAILLAQRALPLFPTGFVRIPTLLRQANLNRELQANLKPSERKRHRIFPVQPTALRPQFSEPIHFPSSLTVTTSVKLSPDKCQEVASAADKPQTNQSAVTSITNAVKNPSASKNETQLNNMFSYRISPTVELGKTDKSEKCKSVEPVDNVISRTDSEKYLPPNNIGSITITPVPNHHKSQTKLISNTVTVTMEAQRSKEPLIRVKSPADLLKEANNIAKKEQEKLKNKHVEKSIPSKIDKNISPLYVDTSLPKEIKKSDITHNSPKTDEIPQKHIESMKNIESNIPRPCLVPVHHSPTFAKPDKRPPDAKRIKRDIVIVSDFDPLSDVRQELLAVDDSSSDVEVVEDMTVKHLDVAQNNEKQNTKHTTKSDSTKVSDYSNDVPSIRDPQKKILIRTDLMNHKKDILKHGTDKDHRTDNHKRQVPAHEKMDVDDAETVIDKVMQNIREMQNSQEQTFNSTFGGVITSTKHVKQSSHSVNIFREPQNEKDKLQNLPEVKIESEVEDMLDVGPTVLQHRDSFYVTIQPKTEQNELL